jgi:hypothetical protein
LTPSPIVSPALIARDSVGNAYDHAMWARGFFATLECELLDRQKFKNQVDARLAVIDFIEGWYNRIGQSATLRSGADPVPDRNYGRHTARATSRPIVESAARAQKSSVWRGQPGRGANLMTFRHSSAVHAASMRQDTAWPSSISMPSGCDWYSTWLWIEQ